MTDNAKRSTFHYTHHASSLHNAIQQHVPTISAWLLVPLGYHLKQHARRGNSQGRCSSCDMPFTYSNTTNAASCMINQTAPPDCRDDNNYEDNYGYKCSDWAGGYCWPNKINTGSFGYGNSYTDGEKGQLLRRCPTACRVAKCKPESGW